MEKLRAFGRWFWNGLGNCTLILGWFVSLGFFPSLLALGKGATPLTYGVAAAAGLLIFTVVRLLWNGARFWRATALARERLSSNSSSFDPMARVFEHKRLFLRDLVPPGRRNIEGRKFINCEIIGPGSIVLGLRSNDTKPWPGFSGNIFWDVDMIQIVPGKISNNAIYFPDCSFENCSFFTLNLLFLERVTEDWYWITPDVSQPTLITATPQAMVDEEAKD